MLLNVPSFREFYEADTPTPSKDTEETVQPTQTRTPDEDIDAAHQKLSSALRADLLERIAQNTPDFFEQLIVDLLVAMGCGGSHKSAATQLGRSGDGGVDGVINEDRLGLDRVYVQAKRYASSSVVGRPDIQAFRRKPCWAGCHQRRIRYDIELYVPSAGVREASLTASDPDRWPRAG